MINPRNIPETPTIANNIHDSIVQKDFKEGKDVKKNTRIIQGV
jgi:hypothetical protein